MRSGLWKYIFLICGIVSSPAVSLVRHIVPVRSVIQKQHYSRAECNIQLQNLYMSNGFNRRSVTKISTQILCGGIAHLLFPAPARSQVEDDGLASAVFSGGNSKLLAPAFESIRYLGVKSTEVGVFKNTESAEEVDAVRVCYDPKRVSYKRVLGAFWRSVDPTKVNAQFGDVGAQFRTVVWVDNIEENNLANESKNRLEGSGLFKDKKLVTEITDSTGWMFVRAPDEEQGWAALNKPAYESLMKKTGRRKWFASTYDPVTTTACEDKVCGYVYFPCSEENGCLAVMNGAW